jgi:hypothetical protein
MVGRKVSTRPIARVTAKRFMTCKL